MAFTGILLVESLRKGAVLEGMPLACQADLAGRRGAILPRVSR
jgi:hypothetical protein